MSSKQPQDSLDGFFLEDESELEGERLSLRWIPVSKIPLLLWEGNPKEHDIGQTWESIIANGFADPAKFDSNLTNVGGGKGALVYGNGRCEAVHWGYTQHQNGLYKGAVPRGVNVDKAGNWYIQCKFGIDAISEAQAIAFGIDHNILTLSGGDFGIDGIMALFDEQALAKSWQKALDGGAELKSLDGQDLDELAKFINHSYFNPTTNPDVQVSEITEADISAGAAHLADSNGLKAKETDPIMCPHCGGKFYVSK